MSARSDKKIPLAIAHRGYSSQFPENSIRAFDEAMKVGADGFECDLRMTSDGEIVVFHDDDLKRLCGVSGTVERSLWKDLRTLTILQSAERIPTLEELLVQFHETPINLEFKTSPRPDALIEKVIRILGKVRPKGDILFSSFDLDCLRALLAFDPQRTLGRCGILVETKSIEDIPCYQRELNADTWNLPRQILDRSWHKEWSSPAPIWLWTLDEPHDWRRACESPLPIEAIISNRPAALRDFLSQRGDTRAV